MCAIDRLEERAGCRGADEARYCQEDVYRACVSCMMQLRMMKRSTVGSWMGMGQGTHLVVRRIPAGA